VFLFLLLAGCASPGGAPGGQVTTATDDLGRNITLEGCPQRIVSLAPSNTEILFALGLGERVVGVTEYCNYPPEALEKEKVGGFSTVDLERVLALEPDLVLASTQTGEETVQKLEEMGIPVAVLDPDGLEGVLEDITLVGRLTGTDEQATALTGDLRARMDAVRERTRGLERPAVFYVVWHDPLMGAGSGTFIADLIETAGGENVARDMEGYQTMSLEVLIERDPEVIIASTGPGQHAAYDWVLGEERLKGVRAVRLGRVHAVDQDLVSRGGPRIVDALEDFAEFIHPELYE